MKTLLVVPTILLTLAVGRDTRAGFVDLSPAGGISRTVLNAATPIPQITYGSPTGFAARESRYGASFSSSIFKFDLAGIPGLLDSTDIGIISATLTFEVFRSQTTIGTSPLGLLVRSFGSDAITGSQSDFLGGFAFSGTRISLPPFGLTPTMYSLDQSSLIRELVGENRVAVGFEFAVSNNGNVSFGPPRLTVTYGVVPEPSSFILGITAATLLAGSACFRGR